MNLEEKIDKLSESIDSLNKSVVELNAIIPTLASKNEVCAVSNELVEVKAMANENRLGISKTYWVLTVIVSVATFLIGLNLPSIL